MRILTNDERKKLKEMGHISPYSFSTITLVLANQVEDIISGRDDHLRRKRKQSDTDEAKQPEKKAKIVNENLEKVNGAKKDTQKGKK